MPAFLHFLRPERTDFDPPEAGHRMLRGDFDGLIEVGAFENVAAGDPAQYRCRGPDRPAVTDFLPPPLRVFDLLLCHTKGHPA